MNRVAIGLIMTLAAGVAVAEQLYVSDKLVVNVLAEANAESEKLTTLDSGDAVEFVEKSDGFTHVKVADGREGWIKSSYLTAQLPAIARIKELEKERGSGNTAANDEIKQLKDRNNALKAELEALKRVTVEAQAAAQASSVAPASAEAPAPAANVATLPSDMRLDWRWIATTGLLMSVVGFLFGYRTLARKIERKYGKLRIY